MLYYVPCLCRWDDSIKVNNIRSTRYISLFLVSQLSILFLHLSILPIDRPGHGSDSQRQDH